MERLQEQVSAESVGDPAVRYGTVAIAGTALFAVALALLHLLDSEVDVIEHYTSDYALGDYGWMMRAGLMAFGVAGISIALGLRATLQRGRRVGLSAALFSIAGAGLLVAGIFNGDPTGQEELTTTGSIHLLAALVLFLSLVVVSWVVRGVFSRDAAWSRFARTQLWFAIAVTGTYLYSFGSPSPPGITQRIFVTVLIAWFLTLGWNIRAVGLARSA